MKLIAAALTIVLLIGGCSGDSPAPSEGKVDDQILLQQAWQEFEAGRYDQAIIQFTQLFNNSGSNGAKQGEALNGRAWSYSYKRDFEKAKSDFVFALGVSGISIDTKNDLRIGHALVLHATNDFLGAITFLSAALAEEPTYSFAHDSRISVKRVRLVLAQSYYATGQFALAAAQLDLIDPAGAPHTTDPPTLLQKIIAAYNSL